VTTLAGSMPGMNDGIGPNAQFHFPKGICFNPHDDCLYVCDFWNHTIRKVNMEGIYSLFSLCEIDIFQNPPKGKVTSFVKV
jgi:sugar lactone lactonase YvrE